MGKTITKKKRKPLPAKVREAASKSLKGNEFWKDRTKHGRDKIFTTPEILWESFKDYIIYNDKRRFAPGIKTRLPYTVAGMCVFFGTGVNFWHQFKKRVQTDKGFTLVVQKIESVLFSQKFEGAAIGEFNASIIARDLGLIDRVDQTSGGEPISAPIVQIVKDKTPKLANDEKELDGK